MRLTRIDATGSAFLGTIGPLPVVVGSGAGVSVRIEGPGVAPAHVRLVRDTIEALAPCLVGDVPLPAGGQRTVVPFVTLRLGEVLLYLMDDDLDALSTPTHELALAAANDGASLWPNVLVVEGPGRGARLVLSEQRVYTIGRREDADLKLDSVTISRHHLDVRRVGDAVHAYDRAATRGTFLGSDRLAPGRAAIWTPHRMIRVGDAVLALVLPRFCDPPSLSLLMALVAPAKMSKDEAAAPSVVESEPPASLAPSSHVHGVQGLTAGIAEIPEPKPVARAARRLADFLVPGLLVLTALLAVALLVYLLVA